MRHVNQVEKCGECSGKGIVAYDIDPFAPHKDLWESCDECEGTGKIIEREPDLDPYPNRIYPEAEMN